jgi:hypothetical protein
MSARKNQPTHKFEPTRNFLCPRMIDPVMPYLAEEDGNRENNFYMNSLSSLYVQIKKHVRRVNEFARLRVGDIWHLLQNLDPREKRDGILQKPHLLH